MFFFNKVIPLTIIHLRSSAFKRLAVGILIVQVLAIVNIGSLESQGNFEYGEQHGAVKELCLFLMVE